MLQVLRTFFRLLAPFLIRLHVEGRENIPDHGPYLIVINHLSAFDTPILLMLCPHKITAFAAAKHRSNLLFRIILEMGGSIWVRRGEIDRTALRRCLEALRAGDVLGLAPEGTRSRSGVLQRGKPGIAYLAYKTDVPILPVAIWGLETWGKSWRRLRRPHVHVVVGKPFRLPRLEGKPRSKDLQVLADQVMYRIAALLPEKYRGVYAGEVPEADTAPRAI